MGDVATLLFGHFNFIIVSEHVFIPEINPHCIFLTADRQSQVMKSTERHFFQNTECTYHCIIMHIFKKQKEKENNKTQ
jgi:hypothetical protein